MQWMKWMATKARCWGNRDEKRGVTRPTQTQPSVMRWSPGHTSSICVERVMVPLRKTRLMLQWYPPDWWQLQTSDEESKACYQGKAKRKSTCWTSSNGDHSKYKHSKKFQSFMILLCKSHSYYTPVSMTQKNDYMYWIPTIHWVPYEWRLCIHCFGKSPR